MSRNSRHLARRCAVQALYQWDVTGQPASKIEESFIKNEKLSGIHLEYFSRMIENIPKYVEQLDLLLGPHLDRQLDKIDPIEHAILRVGTYELLYEADVPTNVVIDEAIGVAKVFASEHSYKFVNGVLDKIAREARSFER
jgi:N utilization substance protein B